MNFRPRCLWGSHPIAGGAEKAVLADRKIQVNTARRTQAGKLAIIEAVEDASPRPIPRQCQGRLYDVHSVTTTKLPGIHRIKGQNSESLH